MKKFLSTLRKWRGFRRDYAYTPLDHRNEEIRLCSINSTPDDGTVHVSVRTVRFDQCIGAYRCLSHVWGDASNKRAIRLNGKRREVNQNLYFQLRTLRRLGLGDNIWIDTLSIDQTNSSERAQQVKFMSRIFSEAREVLVCIDDAAAHRRNDVMTNSTGVQETIEGLAANSHFSELPCFSAPYGTTVQPFINFLSAAWFERSWVVQEVCRAQQATILFPWGTMPWDTLKRALVNWDHHRRHGCLPLSTSLGKDFENTCHRVSHHVQCLDATSKSLPYEQHILTPILRYSELLATDRRDKINAFIGLHTAKSPPFAPSYEISTRDMFRDFTIWLLHDLGSLLPLCLEFRAEDRSLPSWVPDFSARYQIQPDYGRMRLDFLKCYNAANSTESQFKYISPDRLILNGVLVDEIEFATDDYFTIEPIPTHIACLRFWNRFASRRCSTGPQEPGAHFDEEFSTVMLGGCIKEDGVVRIAQRADVDAWNKAILEMDMEIRNDSTDHTSVMESHVAAVLGRRLFLTKAGRLGTGPSTIKPGDAVWILAGGTAPFVLRSTPILSAWSKSPLHKLIGKCYVYGIMNGEAVPSSGLVQQCLLM